MDKRNVMILIGLCVAIEFASFSTAQSTSNCVRNITATSYAMVLTSPGYPGNHRHNLNCRWMIYPTIPSRSIKLTLTDLNTEDCCDYVEIYGGTTNLGRYSGRLSRNIPIVTTQTNMTVNFVADSSIAKSGFRATYKEVNNCGRRLIATAVAGHISTPFYPDPHPPYLDCYWVISSPNLQQKVQVTIEAGRTESCCDYIEVFDKEKSLKRLKGNISRQAFTARGQLNLYFHSNGANSLDGFRASYKIYVCGGTFDVSNDVLQTVMSPNYPNRTDHHLDCNYNFRTSPGYAIEMTITVDTELCCDYVQIFEGSKSLGRLQGSVPRSTIISRGRQLRLVYRTDGTYMSKGFTASFKRFLPKCGRPFAATQSPKVLSSPGYPNLYPNMERCDWTIQARSGYQVVLTVLDFLTETCCDYVEIFDGPISMGKLRGNVSKTFNVVTKTRSLRIHFTSDDSVQKKGFQFRFRETNNCGDKIKATAVVKSISTPYFLQRDYRDNMDCMWEIEALLGLEISLNITQGETEKVHDYIQILDGLNPVAKLSGVLNPQTFLSSGNVFRVYFHSDSTATRDGFLANFEQVCTNSFNVTNRVQFLSSPNYPNRSPHNYKCSYFLNAAVNQRIVLTVVDFHTESCCDKVNVFDGLQLVRQLSGIVEPGEAIYSSVNKLHILYSTDGTHDSLGFRFTFVLASE